MDTVEAEPGLLLRGFHRGKDLSIDGRPEERPFSQFGLYVFALMKIYRVTVAEVARATGISKGTLVDLMRPSPGRNWRPSKKTLVRIYSYFCAIVASEQRQHPTGKHVPSGWHFGMRDAALFNDLSPDIILLQLKEYVRQANPSEEFLLPTEVSAYTDEQLDELEAHYVECLAFIQRMRRGRSRQ